MSESFEKLPFLVVDLGLMPYPQALQIQRDLLARRQKGEILDTLLLVEHPPVLTLGTRGNYDNIYLPRENLTAEGVEIFEVERGGDVTYHGPGQLVLYPIFNLYGYEPGIRDFISKFASAMIELLAESFGIIAEQRFDKYAGVWIGEEKVAAFGLAVKQGVTLHGFAFNINTNLKHFDWINPCGLSKGVTSIAHETGHPVDFQDIKEQLTFTISRQLGRHAQSSSLEEVIHASI